MSIVESRWSAHLLMHARMSTYSHMCALARTNAQAHERGGAQTSRSKLTDRRSGSQESRQASKSWANIVV